NCNGLWWVKANGANSESDGAYSFGLAHFQLSQSAFAVLAASVPLLPKLLGLHGTSHSQIRNPQRSCRRHWPNPPLSSLASGRIRPSEVNFSWINAHSSASLSRYSCWSSINNWWSTFTARHPPLQSLKRRRV